MTLIAQVVDGHVVRSGWGRFLAQPFRRNRWDKMSAHAFAFAELDHPPADVI